VNTYKLMVLIAGCLIASGCSGEFVLGSLGQTPERAALSIETPRKNAVVGRLDVLVRGHAPGLTQVVVDETLVEVSDRGEFAIVVGFEEGAQTIRVEAEGVEPLEVPIVVDTGPSELAMRAVPDED
jgi:hypothetical protein